MITPGSKGWINKYFNLIEKDQINISDEFLEIEEHVFKHAVLGRSGVVFGLATQLIYAKEIDDSKWTIDEKLKVLLFESQFFIYKRSIAGSSINKEEFIGLLVEFYGKHNAYSITKMFTFFLKESKEEKIESILNKRIDIKMNLLENRFWVNYLSNVFIYLDVILFDDFVQHRKKSTIYKYDEMAMNALTAITLAAFSDGSIEKQERDVFNVFLASANLSDLQREIALERFEKGADFSDFTDHVKNNWLFKRFLLDLSVFVIFSNHEAVTEEMKYLNKLCKFLGLNENDLDESLALTEQFVLSNQDTIPFLQSNTSVERVYSSLSKRWVKVLGRNKDKLTTELKQSKELVFLIRKSAKTELTKEEKELVKEQFKDIVKSMPSLAIFLLPGGAFLLPLVLKVIPDLMPSAFRDNEVEK